MTGLTFSPWKFGPVGHGQAICAACGEWCSEQVGCMCCSESAHEWLLAEARWWAAKTRSTPNGHYSYVPPTFPWETQ